MNTAGWMSDAAAAIGGIPLARLSLPGTHDSGTSQLTDRLAPDAPQFLVDLKAVIDEIDAVVAAIAASPVPAVPALADVIRNALGRWTWPTVVSDIVQPMSRAQDRSIGQQLDDGIRYLDLRVAPLEGVPRFCHALFGAPLYSALTELEGFLDQHPKELVILDFAAFYGMNQALHDQVVQSVVETVGEQRLVRQSDPATITPDELWSGQGRVIALHSALGSVPARFQHRFWNRNLIASPWPNTMSVDQLVQDMRHNLAARNSSILFVLQCQLTFSGSPRLPTAPSATPPNSLFEWPAWAASWVTFVGGFAAALNDWMSSFQGLADMAKRSNPVTVPAVATWKPESIAIVDHYEDSGLVETMVGLNHPR